MSDFLEQSDASGPDEIDSGSPREEAGLVSRVSAAGFQVSQALEGLDQVAGLLRAAEELAKDADARRRQAEDAAAVAVDQARELGDLLAIARSEAADVERRATAAEELARKADARRREADEEVTIAEGQARELREILAVSRTDAADVEGRITEAERLAGDAEARRREAEDEAAFAASRARELGELLAIARADAEDVERRAAEAEERATQAEDRLSQALQRTFTLEADLEEANARTPAAKTPRQVTVIVDDKRDVLRDAVGSEIRRPLSSIMGLTLALKHADPSSSEGKHMVRQLEASARRLERLVVQLVELDGIANGSYAPDKRRADLKAIVRRVVEETPDVDGLDVRVHAEHAAIEVDPMLTEQMVETLLANAARRSEPGSTVWVQVSSDHTGAVIAVEDACPDVPAGMVEEVPAARQKKARGATGLALVSRLAELHGGRAWVEERPGGGASFRVFLPSGSASGNDQAEPASGDVDEGGVRRFEEDDADLVVDAASIASREHGLAAELPTEPVRSQVDVYAGLRELSSFDDLSDELAI